MRMQLVIAASAMVMALGVSGFAEADQRDSRGRDRKGQKTQVRTAAPRQNEKHPQPQVGAQPRGGARSNGPTRGGVQDQVRLSQRAHTGGDTRRAAPAPRADGRGYADQRGYTNQRGYAMPRGKTRVYGYSDRYAYGSHNDRYRYYGPPRLVPGYRASRHYYGPSGGFSVYFGIGHGYLYGAPYAGRVYGYIASPVYGTPINYGNVRLLVRPRDAAVYVDGYYAGVVDDFDGVHQRLILQVGPHQIELDAPGLAPRTYDVYVDPARTITIRTDLSPY